MSFDYDHPTPAERAYARQERDPGAAVRAGVQRWTERMSETGRRQAASVAESELRQWVNGTRQGRPSRGEIKAWVTMLVELVRDLHNRLNAATLGAQEAAGLRRELESVTAQRDDALEDLVAERDAHDADVAELGDHRDTLKVMLRKAQCERDALRDELREERKSRGVGRASCKHPGGGAE